MDIKCMMLTILFYDCILFIILRCFNFQFAQSFCFQCPWMLNFVKGFFCNYWDDYIYIFLLFFLAAYMTLHWMFGKCETKLVPPGQNPLNHDKQYLQYISGLWLLLFCGKLLCLYLWRILVCHFLMVSLFAFAIGRMLVSYNILRHVYSSLTFWESLL